MLPKDAPEKSPFKALPIPSNPADTFFKEPAVLTPPINVPPLVKEPIPAPTAPIEPAITASFKESLIEAPLISEAIPLPNAAPQIGPKKYVPTIGSTTGAIFLTTLTTFLATFFTVLVIFLKAFLKKPKNSGAPVSGFMLFESEPTT